MSKGDAFENEILALIFNAAPIANLAQNNGTAPATTLTVALHTADPGEAGTQLTSEIAYTGYARVAVPRTTAGWPAPAGGSISPAANIDFGNMTGGTGGTVTHFSVGTGSGDKLLYKGPVTPNIAVTTGVTPRLTTATAITEN